MSPFDGFDVVFRTLGDPALFTRAINQDAHRVDPALADPGIQLDSLRFYLSSEYK
jgi:hypothetical protein